MSDKRFYLGIFGIVLMCVSAIAQALAQDRAQATAEHTPPRIEFYTKLGEYQSLAIVKVRGRCRAVWTESAAGRWGVEAPFLRSEHPEKSENFL